MAESSFPFASVSGDRIYTAADWAQYFADTMTNGVAGSGLTVAAATGMNVTVAAGGAFINGYHYHNSSTLTLTIDAADATLNRIDRVVVQWHRVNREIKTVVLKGTAASTPAAPALTQSVDIYEISLATVDVDAGVTAIVAGDITNVRTYAITALGSMSYNDLSNKPVITADATYTVGTGGDFTTLSAALIYFSQFRPILNSAGVRSTITLQLKSGFVLAEPITVSALDLAWIAITGVDAETVIDRASITTAAFTVGGGGRFPQINHLFSFNTTGATTPDGIRATNGGLVMVGASAGVKNATGRGVHADSGSLVSCGGSANFSGAGVCGMWALNHGQIHAPSVVASSCLYGLYASDYGSISAPSGNASNCTGAGVITADAGGAKINFRSGTATGCTANGAYCVGGEIVLTGANVRKGASDDPTDIVVAQGGLIHAYGATGGVNQTKNTITSAGLIIG